MAKIKTEIVSTEFKSEDKTVTLEFPTKKQALKFHEKMKVGKCIEIEVKRVYD